MPAPIKTIYEDDIVQVFDKPSGMLVTPSPKMKQPTLTDVVNKGLSSDEDFRLHPCHRLDKETSGLIIYAKGKKNQQLMMRMFQEKKIKKTYVAIVRGKLKRDQGTITQPVLSINERQEKPAVTTYRVLRKHKTFSFLELRPLTGRQHQIRIHLKAIGHPVLGEEVYAFRKDFDIRFRRLALHAQKLEWRNPVTRATIKIASMLPDDMKNFLNQYGISLSLI